MPLSCSPMHRQSGPLSQQAAALLLGMSALAFSADPALAQEAEPATLPTGWSEVLDRLSFHGDFRFRSEADWQRPSGPDRWRARLRLRLGADYSVSDDLLAGARLTTGPQDKARDTNATLGDDFSKIQLNLDRLFLRWTPEGPHPLEVTLGKFGHPFHRNPIYDELVWYSDVQPEGFVVGDSLSDLGGLDQLRGQAGYYVFRERAQGDVRIGVAEVLASERFSSNTRGNASLAWYGYDNASSHPDATTRNYQILDGIADVSTEFAGLPWCFAAEAITNLASSGEKGRGWALGFSCGAARAPGDWRAYYQYQEVGDDAVFSPVASGDLLIEHNFRGHVANLDLVLMEGVTLRTRLLTSEPLDPDLMGGFYETSTRLRVELNVKF